MDRGYLGAAKLSGAYEPDGKISAEFLNETPSALLLMTTRRPFTQHTPATVTNALPTAKLMTFHFQIGLPYRQVKFAMMALLSRTGALPCYSVGGQLINDK